MMPAKNPWWKEYRQKKHSVRETLSIEMIFRKSFVEVLREYVDNCSILGVKPMCDAKIGYKQRIIHICVFCSLVSLFGYFLYIWFQSQANPLIVNSDSSTYPISEIDFPAIALCNVNRISKKALKKVVLDYYPILSSNNDSIEKVEKLALQIGRLLDFSYDESLGRGNKLTDVQAAQTFDTRVVVDIMKTLAPPCSEMLIRCSWNGDIVDCASIFAVRRTALGHCCVFNYILDYDSAQMPNNTIGVAKRQRLPGFLNGLNVVLDPMLGDYAYPLGNSLGFDLLLFDPTHFADLSAGRVIRTLVQPNKAEFVELKSIKQVATSEVRKRPLKTRKCLFKDEMKRDFYNTYSYSACIVKCRIRSIQSLCKCTPYFLPAGKDDGRVCTMDDLKCLNKFKEKLLYLYPIDTKETEGLEVELEDSLFCPDCLPDCELTQHFTKSYKTQTELLNEKPYRMHGFLENLNMTDKSFVSIHHVGSDGVLDRLDVVAYWFEVLSNLGGIGGIILGLSVFSAVEIVYFLVVRFIIIIRYNYLKYH